MVHQVVARHPVQPGGKRPLRRVVSAQRLKDLDKDLLSQVFRLAGSSRETIAQVIDLSAVPRQELFPGRVFAREGPLHQIWLFVHAGSVSLPRGASCAARSSNLEPILGALYQVSGGAAISHQLSARSRKVRCLLKADG